MLGSPNYHHFAYFAHDANDFEIHPQPEATMTATIAKSKAAEVREAINTATYTGKFESAQVLCAKLASRVRRMDAESLQIADICQVLKDGDIGQDYTEKCNGIAAAFLRERKIRGSAFLVKVDLEDQIVFFKILLDLPFEQVYALDDQLARRLIDEVPDFASGAYWLGLDCRQKATVPHTH
jgi:hypothetical protein